MRGPRSTIGTPQAPTAGPRARRRRLVRQGPVARRRAGGLLPVRAADGVPARAANPGPLPGPPDSPLPAVITCIATTAGARPRDWPTPRRCRLRRPRGARVRGGRDYPETGAAADTTSAATPAFWESLGFARASTTTDSRSCAASWCDGTRARRAGVGRALAFGVGVGVPWRSVRHRPPAHVPAASAAAVASDRTASAGPPSAPLVVGRRRRRRRRPVPARPPARDLDAVVLTPDPRPPPRSAPTRPRRLRRCHRGHDGLRPGRTTPRRTTPWRPSSISGRASSRRLVPRLARQLRCRRVRQAGGVAGHAEAESVVTSVHRDLRRRCPHVPRPPADGDVIVSIQGARDGPLRRAHRARA